MATPEPKTVATKLDEDSLVGLGRVAEETGLKIADLLRIAVREFLAKYNETGKLELGKGAV